MYLIFVGNMKINVWISHYFSTAVHFIKLIKENNNISVYATNKNNYSLLLQEADFFEIEPNLNDEEYINYALDFCKKNNINIFFPNYLKISVVSKNKYLFEKIGVKVIVDSNYELIEVLDNKEKTYKLFENIIPEIVPEYYIVDNYQDFSEAYNNLISKEKQVCFKPVEGVGGKGFRIIDEWASSINSLFAAFHPRMTYKQVIDILKTEENFPKLIVMEYLSETEYSIDCFGDGKKLLVSIPRRKMGERIRILEDNKELLEMAEKIYPFINLEYAFNLQFRFSKGVPKLLEINPRLSGGSHVSCASGINLPLLCVQKALNQELNISDPNLNIIMGEIETEIKIKNINW